MSCLNLTVCAGCYYVELCCSRFHFSCLVRTYTDAVKQQQGYQTSYLSWMSPCRNHVELTFNSLPYLEGRCVPCVSLLAFCAPHSLSGTLSLVFSFCETLSSLKYHDIIYCQISSWLLTCPPTHIHTQVCRLLSSPQL